MKLKLNNASRGCALLATLFLAACAATPPQPPCNPDRQNLPDCPPQGALQDPEVDQRYQRRSIADASALQIDPIKLGMEADVPVKDALGKVIGSSYEESIASLAAKMWLVDNARFSVDAVYYIFTRDLVGYAFLGALCEAVERGVDVRVMVDSLGSNHPTHSELKALRHCATEGGFAVNSAGQLTTRKARVQAAVFGALTQPGSNYNRRSHDKLLVVDGSLPEYAWVMTGGRNISLAYYGLNKDGSRDPNAYKDLELLLRPAPGVLPEESVGRVSEDYVSILLANPGNKVLSSGMAYAGQRKKMQESLAALRAMPDFQRAYDAMPVYLQENIHPVRTRIAHELGNIVSDDVVGSYDENLAKNPNSIVYIARKLEQLDPDNRTIRIVSPYLFLPRYERDDGSVFHDSADNIQRWLDEHPDNRLEIVTNSVLTSDNFFTQSIIDMDTAPSLLLDEASVKQWRKKLADSELNPELVASDHWQRMINNPRIQIYQTGRLDADLLGGDVAYGKLHAKFFLTDAWAFVGTTNLDYRSLLFNNEMGFYVVGEPLREELVEEFEALKSQSYRWGTPEWLQMRAAVREKGGMKGVTSKRQRSLFKNLRQTGLHWQF